MAIFVLSRRNFNSTVISSTGYGLSAYGTEPYGL